MADTAYETRRSELQTYFGQTAADNWTAITGRGPVSRIRASVRAGREAMQDILLSWLPADLQGARVLDAGCGTGAIAVELARRGADVVAVDLSPKLIDVARQRTPGNLPGSVLYLVGDMMDARLGGFDHVVAMDSFIHYDTRDLVSLVGALASRTNESVLFTFAPRTPLLALMHTAGQFFPRNDRSPAIVPVGEGRLTDELCQAQDLERFAIVRTRRISTAFYKSQALELVAR